MSDAKNFNDKYAINTYMDSSVKVDVEKAEAEHAAIKQALIDAGVTVKQVPSPVDCQDGVYAANWALVRNGKALMARLPNARKAEEPYALKVLQGLGIETVTLPESIERFSGQGDALPCGDLVFTQSPYRTSKAAHAYIASVLGFEVIELETKPTRWFRFGPAKINKVSGWPDSPTYDIDMALSILRWPSDGEKGLIAYCPAAFKKSSRKILECEDRVDKIIVSKKEALSTFCCNLVSTGETVIMNHGAPKFKADLEAHGLKTVILNLPELKKGGGSIRCSSLTLDN